MRGKTDVWEDERVSEITGGPEREFVGAAFAELRAKFKQVYPGAVKQLARFRKRDAERRDRRFAKCIAKLRDERGRDDGTRQDDCSQPEAQLLKRECIREIRSAIRTLPMPLREVVNRCKILQESPTEVARSLGRPLATVLSWLHKGQELLGESSRLASLAD